ncbi:MAG: hypothetical protein AAFY02_21130 [Pseudomonadota bacterium]
MMRASLAAAGLLVSAVIAFPALAADTATGAQISSAISGNTVQGSMLDGSAYTEFYQTDGTIKGDGYTGAWMVEGNQMCFQYGSDPANCWDVMIDGDQVTWMKDGAADGTGTIVSGNPNGF